MSTSEITKIDATVPVTTDGMGDGWTAQDAAAEAYADWLQAELTKYLESIYPNAVITVECPVLCQSGGGHVSAIVERADGDQYPGDIEDMIHSVSQDLWGRWVGDAELTSHLTVDE